MARPRLRRPSPSKLSAALILLGLVAGLAFVLVPVDVSLGDDPLFRLQPFSPGLVSAATVVDCGRPVGNIGRTSDGLSLYDLARDGACRAAASRRVAAGVATASLIGVLGLVTLAGRRPDQPAPAPARVGA